MNTLTTRSNIIKFSEKIIKAEFGKWLDLLKSGNLYEFENSLNEKLIAIYNCISEELLPRAAIEIAAKLEESGKKKGCKKLELRPLKIRISTGHKIEVKSFYAKEVPKDWKEPRHMLSGYWKTIGNASPGLYDKVCFCSALGPSYDIGHQTLSKFNVDICLSSVRDITNHVSDYCYKNGEENLLLEEEESLEGKRVVLSIDGGRTRTRIYTGQFNKYGNPKYDTQWCEPKLFVIDILDKNGQPDRNALPIYGCRFGEQDMFDLLERYLNKLEIRKAEKVQVIGDGAPWIWNNVSKLLVRLGVDENKIIETLDYYHSSGYVHDLVEHMPNRVKSEERKNYLKEFKELLWAGKSNEIVEQCRQIYRRPSQLIKRWIEYLDKHTPRTQYIEYQGSKLMCGSGIIESAVRRIINLRFKNASTFWEKTRVQKMYFLRGALLSKRWGFVMNNLVS